MLEKVENSRIKVKIIERGKVKCFFVLKKFFIIKTP